MKVTKHDGGEAKRILTAMIVDPVVVGRIAERWKPEGLFKVKWANLVGGWCVDFHNKYRAAPGQAIEGLFESWAARATDDDTISLMDRFLANVSGEYEDLAEESNSDYMIDLAGDHFNGVAMERMADIVKGHIDRGDTAAATAAVAEWDKVELGAGAGIDVMNDEAAIREAFESKTEPLITYRGALGDFFGDQLARDEFVAFTGATGRGKTWWLIDLAWQAVRQRKKVAFFEVGDMSQNQIMRRFMCRAAGHPLKPPRGQRWPCNLKIPTSIARDADCPVADVLHEDRQFDAPLRWQAAWAACQKKMRRRKHPLLRLSVHPNSSLPATGISSALDVWERAGWVPDVVVVDYADILAVPPGYAGDSREAINATWKQLRSLSQQRHILCATATQADAASYTANTISRSNFSDDRRKNDHVTAMCGINATEEEQAAGVFRLNWTKRREEEYIESRCVHVAGCLSLGRPAILSTF